MNYSVEEFKVKSSDNVHLLAAKAYIPSVEIKGIFHLVHGMTEYIDRYDYLMSKIAQAGYICCGYDNLGHGKTVNDDSELGFIAQQKGYEFLIEDVKVFADFVKKEYNQQNYILMGHSMGSFIARIAAQRYKNDLSYLIICGTGGPNPLSSIGLLMADILMLLKGKRGYSPLLEDMAFGSYNKRFEKNTNYEWLTKDRRVIDKYIADKYCTFHFTISALHDLVKLNSLCNKKSWFKNINKALPILIISGAEDPVGNYGKGVRAVYNGLIRLGNKNTKLKLYKNCRHEIHNDSCKDEMLEDIKKFIEG